MKSDGRTREQIEQHYRVERELADRLRRASRAERRKLYPLVYDELFARVPSHPMLARKSSPEDSARDVARQMRLLQQFLKPECVFLEIGPGDCALSFEVARQVKKVYAVEVSAAIASRAETPANFELILSDGCSITLPDASVDVVYSNQLMEHLHPEDALEQLRDIQRILRPGGVYVCLTPDRLTGPHDVSYGFDAEPTGFHLKEYTAAELADLFRSVGFRDVKACLAIASRYFMMSVAAYRFWESLVAILPAGIRSAKRHMLPMRLFLDLRMV
ncbi:MAG TPA: class I SAM-dependent methyltransferase, partial [Candidatus Nitrosotenuis sp.]|nr:class I SAM-dependent methyltransferase [Candidatus Nitrosotenuis sp.]